MPRIVVGVYRDSSGYSARIFSDVDAAPDRLKNPNGGEDRQLAFSCEGADLLSIAQDVVHQARSRKINVWEISVLV
ncbi:MAG: hypothetical protein V1778_01850 [bacterium]